jgi:RimJ/RimL family protein N-acetyltransferase
MSAPRFETERLVLRAFGDRDRAPFADLNADPEVMRYFPAALAREESDAFIDRIAERWLTDRVGLWAIERRADGAFLGFAGLAIPRFQARFTPCVEVGWRLARSAWGRGYATEAARESLRFGFEDRGLDEILSWTTVANERSRRVMERLGMTRDPADDFEHPSLPPGHPIRAHVLYRLSGAAWQSGT